MSTTPAPAGCVAVISVDDTAVNDEALTVPNMTLEADEKLVPVIVTRVPLAVVDDVGLTAVTAGVVLDVVVEPVPVDVTNEPPPAPPPHPATKRLNADNASR